MISIRERPRLFGRYWHLDDRGVALPLALVGVIFVSILVTGMLVTSSLESAMSRAHQDGLQSIYESEGAVEAFVEENFETIWRDTLASEFYAAGQVGNPTARDITLTRLRDQSGPVGERDITTSIIAEPANGRGRSVGVLLTHLVPPVLETDIDAGLVFASRARVAGTALISDGTDQVEECDDGTLSSGKAAIRFGSDVKFDLEGSARNRIVGDTVRDEGTGAELVASSLGGSIDNISSLAQFAQKKFGERYGTDTYLLPRDPMIAAVDTDGTPRPRTNRFNWGCPAKMPDNQECVKNGGDTDYFPSVAIDAEGGMVSIQNHHGQGTLMVVNGGLSIDGAFAFRGIIMVEGNLRIAGGGASASIEGAVIAGGDTEVLVDEQSNIDGSAVIRFNQCAIRDAERGFHDPGHNSFRRTGWFEVVR
jgi:hypothetical protein